MSTTNVARMIFEVNKAVVGSTVGATKAMLSAAGEGVSGAVKVLRDSGSTVVGQGRSAADRTVSEAAASAREAADRTMTQATRGARETAGQARAQGGRASERLDEIADRTARRMTAAVDDSPSTGTPYEQWTKSELYERAQELDIEGRSGMSKRELIAALRSR